MIHVVLVGTGENSIEIVKQALDELNEAKEEVTIDAIVFDEKTKEFEEEQISIEIGSQEDRDFLKSFKKNILKSIY